MKYFIICLCLCLTLAWTGGSSTWPQFQCDAKNSGYTNIIPPNNPGLVWVKNLNTQISVYTSPIVIWVNGDEAVCIGAVNGLYCLSSIDGHQIWFRPTSGPVIYAPAFTADKLFFAANDSLICINPSNASFIWSYKLDNPVAGHLTLSGSASQYLYLVDAGGKLYAFNTLTNQFLWKTAQLGPGFDNQAPAVDDSGFIYVVTLGNTLAWYDYRFYKFNQNGQQIWLKEELFFEPGGARMSPTIGPNGDIYFGLVYSCGWSSSLYAYHPNGNFYWRKTDNSGLAYSSPAVSGNNSMVIYGAYGNNGSFVRRLNTAGNLSWSYSTNIRYSSPAVCGNNWIVFGTRDGKFMIINDGGNLCYQYNCDGSLTSACIGWDQFKGAIYIASENGKVYKFGNPGGVGVEEKNISGSTQIKCWPNPCQNFLNISLDKPEKVRIFDASGREVFSENGKEIVWQSSDLPSGIYFIQIGKQSQQRHKVVKLK